jgi:hypothetical protein
MGHLPKWSRAIAWFVATLGLALTGCHYRYDFSGVLIAIPTAQKLVLTVPNIDIVLVADDGTVFPKEVLIRQTTHAVIWVSPGDNLDVAFKDSRIKPDCKTTPHTCTLGILTLPYDSYEYGGNVTDSHGTIHKLDPHLEVVK